MSNFWGLFLFEKRYLKNKLKSSFLFCFFYIMKKYWSLIGITVLVLLVGRLWYLSYFAYLDEHNYYLSMLSSWQNRWIFGAALVCAGIPLIYWLMASKIKIKNLLIWLWIWAAIFWLIHCYIKDTLFWFWSVIAIFHTLLLFWLAVYLILWFSALWSRVERKLIKFKQFRWQEIFLSFWIWLSSFLIIVQILLWIGILYWIVSWLLFLWLWFMIRYERENLKKRWNIICDILENYKLWLTSWTWNLNSKSFWNWKKIWFLVLFLPIILSLAYLYMWIQNAFVPYSTAWDANHEYMYTPKVLAENAWIYRWNTVVSSMPWFWHQFLTFIFSLTGCTNWWLGLSPDNIAVSMNNISATLVLIFWIAIIFQIFSFVNNKKEKDEDEKAELKKWKNVVVEPEMDNSNWTAMWWYMLLLRLTGWMWAFLVIVDNKTDLWVMALSLLALLAGLIFLQNRRNSKDKKELFKYILIAWLFFGFAALAKITAFVDFVLFGLLLVWLRFSSLTSLWLWIMAMWFVRKFNVLTSSVMLTDENATWLIIIWWIITVIWLIIYLLKRSNRKEFWKNFRDLIIFWIWFLLPLIVLKLPRATISQIKTDNYSFWNSMKAVFLGMNNWNKAETPNKLLAQNSEVQWDSEIPLDTNSNISLEWQDLIDSSVLTTKKWQDFSQCSAAGDIYSEKELNEWLEEIVGWWWGEDLWRYIWYWWKTFSREWNWIFWLLKLLRPTSETCYWFNHDAKVLCNNASVIDSFKIDDLRGIYENWINNKEWEAWLLLKKAIDSYDKAKKAGESTDSSKFYDEIVALRQYYQSHSISSSESDSVSIPYWYIVPLNISFNWSLQNLSSYYTDIGFFWIIVYIFLLIALPYALIKKDKILTSIALTTLIWWWIWWIIGSSILWYGTALISRTMITLALLWENLLRKDKNGNPKIVPRILVILVWIIFWVQIILNFVRIASQWANSVFVWYKWNVGRIQVIDDNLQPSYKLQNGYWWKDIFDLQFPQYNPIINALANRDNDDWVVVAWTYIQYFLWNQWNIKWDWMLEDFFKKSSDWDLCKLYWRLRKDNTRYLIIDPNIWTVTMWEWNETLFYRFFAKLSRDNSKIEKDGTITSLIRLAREWYIKLLSTNNVGAKYAFTLSDDEIRWYVWWNMTDDELILQRSKMAVLQYFGDADSIFWTVANIFINRIMSNREAWIEDIANIYWLEVDTKKIANAANAYINWTIKDWDIGELTQAEKSVLVNYLNIYIAYSQWHSEDWQSMVQNILLSSVTWWSQVIALELN